MTLLISDITSISKNPNGVGYLIIFSNGNQIEIHKRRTIPALLTLIKFGEGCETDLTKSSTNLSDLKKALEGKINQDLFQDSYADANKPFSELWNEEGFTFITNPVGQTRLGSKKYVLDPLDHPKLFTAAKKAGRKPPSKSIQDKIYDEQKGKCNLCDSIILDAASIAHNDFSKDRRRKVWDHRIPVEKGGLSNSLNYQALCFYCNKSKWQICNICTLSNTQCQQCALAFPENTSEVAPTKEDISDRALHHHAAK